MVYFKFSLSDIDAENLFGIINAEKIRVLDKAIEALCDGKKKEQKAYKKHAKYIDSLKSKIKRI